MLKITELINKNAKIKGVKMNTNNLIKNGIEPFTRYNFSILVVGPPNSGKTSFIIDQLTRPKRGDIPEGILYKKFNQVFIMSPSLNTIDKNLNIPEEQIFNEYNPEILEKIILDQQKDFAEVTEINKLIDIQNKEDKTEVEHEPYNEVLLVIDDFQTEISKDKTKFFSKILMNRRHLRISLIVLVQVFRKLSPTYRKSFSNTIFFKNNNRQELAVIQNELTSFTNQEFKQLIDCALVEPHDFLIFSNNSNKIYRNLNPLEITQE